ncbi:MAG: nitroreductase family protein [Bacillota bacterium]
MNDTAIPLPAPDKAQPHSVLAVLEKRQSTWEISDEPLPRQVLANLLWAAYGVNRHSGPLGSPGRTAGAATNVREIDVYVALKSGAYLYNAMENRLEIVNKRDLRLQALLPDQRSTHPPAAVELIFVADVGRFAEAPGFDQPERQDPEVQKSYYFVDTGFIAANVYVYAAAVGLAAWFHDCDKAALGWQLGLKLEQRVLFAQSVGYREDGED